MLCKNLIGIYVHGSIAFGCFNRERSDIDFIVVVKSPVSEQVKLQLLQVLEDLREQAPPKGFEMSVVLERYCKKFVYPTPYELHFSNDCLKQYLENPLLLCNDDPKTDYDLAAHFTVITNAGVVLCGKPISEVFSDIPREEYLDSIRKDIENAREDMVDFPVNVILNLCRVYSYIRDGLVLSKAEGGQWGLINLPEKYHSLIAAMLDNYIQGTDTQSMAFCKDKTLQIDFCEYMLNLIFNPTV
ncbi:MAG: DUF4111 domain-containing protein [Methanosarcinales archaeon]|nr:DUF4111 domain-containing protein [Methanosarcinales archaeon]